MLLLAFLISIGTSAFGQLVKEVTLSPETNLAAALGDEAAQVTTLKISGPLREADFTTMKDEMKMLQVLDMSGVTELPSKTFWENGNSGIDMQSIPAMAFEKKLTLQRVIFPACLERIEKEAFQGCSNLFTIVFPEASNLKIIGGSAFSECSGLQALDLSGNTSLMEIRSSAFSSCKNLKNVNLSGCTALQTIGNSGFSSCSALQKVDLSNCSRLTSIGGSAFWNCTTLKEVTLTGCSALQTIGNDAFQSCSALADFDFTQLTALSSIGPNAFSSTAFAGDITFSSSIDQLGEGAFSGCKQITSIDFSNSSLTAVSTQTFANCYMLQKADFSGCSSLNTLSKDAFQDCSSLKEIVIDNGFYKSQDGVLYTADMRSLMLYPAGKEDVSFAIPNGVEIIQSSAIYLNYYYTYQIKDMTIPSSVINIQPNAFRNYRHKTIHLLAQQPIGLSEDIGLTEALVYVPKGSLAAYKEAAIWKDYTLLEEGAEGITIQLESAGSLKAKLAEQGIAANTIQVLTVTGPMNCSDFEVIQQMKVLIKCNLKGASMEEKRLPDNSFRGMYYLQEVELPDDITTIGTGAFGFYYDVENISPSIKKVNLPKSLERIEGRAFEYCRYLEEMPLDALPNLKKIGYYAFHNSSAAPTNLVLPNSIEYIEEGAFSGTNVTSVDFANTSLRGIDRYAFQNCPITGKLVFPATLNHIGDRAFNAATVSSIKLKSIEMVQLESDKVFESIDKSTWKVYVPKGLGDTYKADSYWSAFGNNIVEYGHLISATTNHRNYEMVSGGGAYEEGETVILNAKLNDESDWENKRKVALLFAGWYEGDVNVSKDLSMQFAASTDRKLTAIYNDITFNTNIYTDKPVLKKKSQDLHSITVCCDITNIEGYVFSGWYENDVLISSDKEITIDTKTDSYDRYITARFVEESSILSGLINDNNKVNGQDVKIVDETTVEGDLIWKPRSLNFLLWSQSTSLLVNSPIQTNDVSVTIDRGQTTTKWAFIAFPFDVKLSEIITDGAQFVVRRYDGASRATNGMGASWKQLSASDVLKAKQGYIIQTQDGNSFDVVPSSEGSALFLREAVTTPLAAHASAVTADANWNLVGNPFPCYFSVKQLFDDGLDGTVTVWSDELQNYEYYTKDDPNAYLSPLSAFFIQHDQAASVTFKPEGRLAEKPSALRSAARQEEGRKVINLLLSNGSLSDKTRIVFNESASTAYELGKDAAKFSSMNPDAPMLYTLGEGNQQLAINERPMGEGILPLGCYFGQQGEYTLSAQTELTDDLYLYDQQTGACVNLKEEAYRFDAQAGNSADRFELRTALKGTGIEAIEGLKWQVRNGQLQLTGLPAGATVTVADALGRICFAGDAATAEQCIALPESGIYYLTIRTAEGRTFSEAIKR